MKSTIFFLSLILASILFSQHQTIGGKTDGSSVKSDKNQNFLIIPFLPKLYNSQIDYLFHKESGKNSRQLAEYFRDGINEAIYQELKKRKYKAVDLMSDTVKYKKEMASIYRNSYLEYMLVPNQENYEPPKKEQKQKGIKEGQIVVEPDVKDRFMNAKISDARLIPALYARFRTDYFIFINQLDFFSSPYKDGEIQNMPETNKKRLAIHYTVYSLDAEEVNSGLAELIMDEEKYAPDVVLKKYIKRLALIIVDRIELQIQKKKNKKLSHH